jgi:hypothetical protein
VRLEPFHSAFGPSVTRCGPGPHLAPNRPTGPVWRCLLIGVDRNCPAEDQVDAFVKVCGCRPHEGGAAHTRGRRTQTSKGGNRGRYGEAARQTLWGFWRWRSVADVH